MNSLSVNFLEWFQGKSSLLTACAILVALACFVVYMDFRQQDAKHKEQGLWLADFDFSVPYFEDMKKRHPHLAIDEIVQAFEKLRNHFLLCWQRSPQALIMPTGLVDDCWKVMILDTRQYHKFCNCAFGKYLHHEPNGLMADSFTCRNELEARGKKHDGM
jgi:hypothetical protein